MVPLKVLKYGTPKPSYSTLIETLIDPFKEPIKDAAIRFLKGFKPSDPAAWVFLEQTILLLQLLELLLS